MPSNTYQNAKDARVFGHVASDRTGFDAMLGNDERRPSTPGCMHERKKHLRRILSSD